MIIPFKQFLTHESRMLGIKPHTLYCRIYRGNHPMPPVARQVGKRIMLVETSDPRHDKWVKHAELVQAARDALRAVYADQDVEREQVIESLDELAELIETLLQQIPI